MQYGVRCDLCSQLLKYEQISTHRCPRLPAIPELRETPVLAECEHWFGHDGRCYWCGKTQEVTQ